MYFLFSTNSNIDFYYCPVKISAAIISGYVYRLFPLVYALTLFTVIIHKYQINKMIKR